MILSHKEIEEIAAAVTKDFNEFFFGPDTDGRRLPRGTPIDQLHRNLAKGSAIQEFMLYDMTTKPEYEANIVAAEILLDTDEILEYIYDYGYTSEQIARAMGTDINLVALKIAHLAESGYDLRRIEHRSDFLK